MKRKTEILYNILRIFDRNIDDLKRLDDHYYQLSFKNKEFVLTDAQLIHRLSSGTTKGILLYTLLAASLKVGLDLLSDEVENHFHVGGGQNNHSKGGEKRPILGKLRNQQLSLLNLFSNRFA